jgi:hypothetical protein
VKIKVWICRCGNYYASSSARDLSTEWNRDIKNRKTHTRDRCPDCGEKRTVKKVNIDAE